MVFDGAQSSLMKRTLKSRFMQSFVVLPLLGTAFTGNPLMAIPTALGGVNSLIANVQTETISPEELTRIEHAAKIDTFFEEHDMPLAGYGRKMVEVAEANDLDWRLLPAIAVRESTGGRQACKKVPNSHFGWGSCKIGFKSTDDEIATIGVHLGGNNPKTANHYDGKDTAGILRAYNPPSIVPTYTKEVFKIMDMIDHQSIDDTIANTDASASQS